MYRLKKNLHHTDREMAARNITMYDAGKAWPLAAKREVGMHHLSKDREESTIQVKRKDVIARKINLG